jgi:hypothetical protein
MTSQDIFMLLAYLCVIAALVVMGLYAAEKCGIIKEPVQIPELLSIKFGSGNTTIRNGTMSEYGHNASVSL